jgi:hypothetical protein
MMTKSELARWGDSISKEGDDWATVTGECY